MTPVRLPLQLADPNEVLKRRFAAEAQRRREQEDDLTWLIPDMPVDFGVGE